MGDDPGSDIYAPARSAGWISELRSGLITMQLPALDQLPVPLFRCDADGRITYVNDAWRDSLCITIGTLWYAPFPDIDRVTADNLWVQCVDAIHPTVLSSRAELEGQDPRWFELVLQPVQLEGSMEMLGSLIDVTEQTVAAAETLAILDTAVDGIIVIDGNGRIETFNQAASDLFGYSADEAIGKSINMLMTGVHESNHNRYLSDYLRTGKARIIGMGRELIAKSADGTKIPIYLAVSEVHLDGKRRFAGIVRNLTEQYAAREALASQREKLAHVGRLSTMGEMTASIAHEINQPLTAIAMYAQASLKLLERTGSTEKIKGALEKLNTQALRAGAVIERIQRFARAQETSKELLDINELVTDLLKLAGSDARMHDIELMLDLAGDLPQIFADPVQIQQVILNLIRNGIDAMNEIHCKHGRTITLETRCTNGVDVEVIVSDLGHGVADDQADLLFTPFHTTKKEGMGMGLSICRSIISEHGGELRYRDHPGPGASFFFSIPSDHD
ncbi:MAG: PAS domain S-box protein [Pseudomonadales bacterium]